MCIPLRNTFILSDMFAGFAVGKGEETKAAIRKVGSGSAEYGTRPGTAET